MKHRLPCFSPRYAATGAKRLWRNTLTWVHRPCSGWAPPPVLVVLNPTESCNLRCRMCFERGEDMAAGSWGDPGNADELSAELYHRLIRELSVFAPTFYITGGEPLVSDKTVAVIEHIKSHGLYVSLNTNGVLLKDNALALVESGLDKIIISLDGPAEVHDAIRGDTFNRIAQGIALVEKLKNERGTRTPLLRAQCVISPYNAGYLDRTAGAAAELGIGEIRFQHLMFAFSEDSLLPDNEERSLVAFGNVSSPVLQAGALDMSLLKSEIETLRNRPLPPRIRFEPEIRTADLEGYYRDPLHAFRNDCLSPWRRLVISAQGLMGPCQGMYLERYPEVPVLEAWRGERFRRLRRHILGNGLFPHCLRCCHREYYGRRIGLDVQ